MQQRNSFHTLKVNREKPDPRDCHLPAHKDAVQPHRSRNIRIIHPHTWVLPSPNVRRRGSATLHGSHPSTLTSVGTRPTPSQLSQASNPEQHASPTHLGRRDPKLHAKRDVLSTSTPVQVACLTETNLTPVRCPQPLACSCFPVELIHLIDRVLVKVRVHQCLLSGDTSGWLVRQHPRDEIQSRSVCGQTRQKAFQTTSLLRTERVLIIGKLRERWPIFLGRVAQHLKNACELVAV
mmetsp:Transcript_59812/g.133260  ORF Transcript_59812/g.133260 Transcript_59812/m.133260 type:complete len:236 (+) Transcript_59812:214-921(+)